MILLVRAETSLSTSLNCFSASLLVLAFLFLHLAQVFYRYHFNLHWEHLFLFLATYCLFSCWRHIHKQYLMMAFPRPEQVIVDVESVVRDYLRPATAVSPPGDLPPKYEEVQAASVNTQATSNNQDEGEEAPPQYDESMAVASVVLPPQGKKQ